MEAHQRAWSDVTQPVGGADHGARLMPDATVPASIDDGREISGGATVPAIGLVDANPVARLGLGTLLGQQSRLRVEGLFAGYEELVERTEQRELVILYDLKSARRDGLAAVAGLPERLAGSKVVMINVPNDDQAIIDCARSGVAGCILDDVPLDDLVDAVHSAAHGVLPVSPGIITTLYDYLSRRRPEDDRMVATADLTPREHQVLQLIADGLTNKEIARQLLLQTQTVKNYVRVVLEKLGVNNRLAVIRMLRAGSRS